jgi:DNA polymerase/3'-5' exonuclease PolX
MTKIRFPLADAEIVARDLLVALAPACERIEIAGSIRRRRPDVGDVEIVYVPRWQTDVPDPGDFFRHTAINLVDGAIANLERCGVLGRRTNAVGREMFGEKNKLAVHVASGIPVDLFATSEECWWNYLVCRTGGAESNVRIAAAAQRIGCKWTPYGSGFLTPRGMAPMHSEEEVFAFVGLPHLPPASR